MSEKVYFPGQIKEEYRGNRTIVLVKNPKASNSYDGENVGTFNYDLLDILHYIATGENPPTKLNISSAKNHLDEMPVFDEEFFHMTGEGRKHYPLERVYMGVNNSIANEIMGKRHRLSDGSTPREGAVTFKNLDQLIVKEKFL